MLSRFLFVALFTALLALSAPGVAAPSVATPGVATSGADAKDPRVELLKKLPPGTKLEALQPSPVPGLYEFSQGVEVSYLTTDGKYFVDGSIYDMDTHQNLSEERRNQARLKLLAAIPESQLIIFSPKVPQYTITVFTDLDCAYCRQLHSGINELNKLGVRVRYAAFPRTGPNTDSWRKAEAVWCAQDRQTALTQAKLGAPVNTSKLCANDPVAKEYQLGEALGVRGTPSIFSEGGDFISGYLPPAELVRYLKDLKASRR
ncbi:MAG: DsbC family protein [Proteobacteria bacterium]|nr:DsbC family protein [Pseudomonadota bacterium]